MNHQEGLGVRLKPGALILAQSLWGVALVAPLHLFLRSLPYHYRQLTVIAEQSRSWQQLTFDEAIALRGMGLSLQFYATTLVILETIVVAMFLAVGIFLFWSRRGDGVAIFSSAVAILFGFTSVPSIQTLAAVHFIWDLQVDLLMALGLILPLILIYIFPDGRFLPSWTRGVAIGWSVWMLLTVFTPAINVERLPFPLPFVIKMVIYSTGIYAQVYRYFRISTRTQRQQTKWVIFGFSAAFAGFFLFNLPFALSETINEPGLPRVFFLLLGYPLLSLLPMLLVPVTISFAILRYKLWDIDILLNQTLVYTVLTVSLGGIYFGLGIVLQGLASALTNQKLPGFVTVLSTLTIAAMIIPLRSRIQAGIDRRFYRRKYDFTQILASFGATLRQEIDLGRLLERLEQVIFETMGPAYVITWLENGSGYAVFALEGNPSVIIPSQDPLVQVLQKAPGLVFLEEMEVDSPLLGRLRRHHVRAILPLVSHGRLIGWLTLGARLSGQEYNREDRRLLEGLARQAAPGVQVAHLLLKNKAEALEKEGMAYELQLARDIQRTLFPGEHLTLKGWSATGHYRPATSVGGDFYDFLPLPDGQLGVLIGDATDKGIPAALVMATSRSLLRAIALDLVSPGKVLERANALLHGDIPANMFVTCLFLLFDPSTGRLRFANAGHCLPLVWNRDNIRTLKASGMPLGLLPGSSYAETETSLAPGEGFLLYTDGVIEARRPDGRMFEMGGLSAALCQHAALDGEELIRALLEELIRFSGPQWKQEDDITLVVVK